MSAPTWPSCPSIDAQHRQAVQTDTGRFLEIFSGEFQGANMAISSIYRKPASVDGDPRARLLWVIREHLKLTGTRYGCGAGLCGACTVHVDGRAVRSCLPPCRVSPASPSPPSRACQRTTTIRRRRRGSSCKRRMRKLPIVTDHAGRRSTGHQQESKPRRDRRAHEWKHLPLRDLSASSAVQRATGQDA